MYPMVFDFRLNSCEGGGRQIGLFCHSATWFQPLYPLLRVGYLADTQDTV